MSITVKYEIYTLKWYTNLINKSECHNRIYEWVKNYTKQYFLEVYNSCEIQFCFSADTDLPGSCQKIDRKYVITLNANYFISYFFLKEEILKTGCSVEILNKKLYECEQVIYHELMHVKILLENPIFNIKPDESTNNLNLNKHAAIFIANEYFATYLSIKKYPPIEHKILVVRDDLRRIFEEFIRNKDKSIFLQDFYYAIIRIIILSEYTEIDYEKDFNITERNEIHRIRKYFEIYESTDNNREERLLQRLSIHFKNFFIIESNKYLKELSNLKILQ